MVAAEKTEGTSDTVLKLVVQDVAAANIVPLAL